jgi:hypothetical protein
VSSKAPGRITGSRSKYSLRFSIPMSATSVNLEGTVALGDKIATLFPGFNLNTLLKFIVK